MTGHAEERVWNSFFLQYLWEFCLGMKLAELYHKKPETLTVPKWKHLVPACIAAMALTGVMGMAGFPWKLYNDIPSLIGYTSIALIIYKTDIKAVNRFFSYTNKFSYEWYLVHILVFQITRHFLNGHAPFAVEIGLCLALSYLMAMAYGRLWGNSPRIFTYKRT